MGEFDTDDGVFLFRVGELDLLKRVHQASKNALEITIKLNGDELDAALWGLENYKKNGGKTPIIVFANKGE